MEVYQKAKNSILRNSKFLSGKIFQWINITQF
jgi:hypothetical protein